MSLLAIGAWALAVVPIGCGGAELPPPSGELPVILQPDVQVMPGDGSVTISAVTDDGITVNGAAPELKPGSVIVSGEGVGLARKVVSVTTTPAGQVCTTTNATLTDIFKEAHIRVQRSVAPSDLVSIEMADGVEYVTPAKPTSRDPAEFTFKIQGTFPGAEGSAFKMTTSASVTVSLDLGLSVDIEDGALIRFTYAPSVSAKSSCDLAFKGKLEAKFPEEPTPYATMRLSPFIVQVGVIPVAIFPKISLSAQMVLSVEGGAKLKVEQQTSLKSGVSYNAVYNEWTPIEETTFFGVADPVANAYISAEASLSLAQAKIELLIFGIAGPALEADIGKLSTEWKAKADFSVQRSCSLGFTIGGEVKADMFGKRAKYTFGPALDKSFKFWEKTFVPGTGEVDVTRPEVKR